ncbi:hypothetical protein KP509_27G068900 [Ceratopteris richardii]|uniref:Aquaporin n=2 Tax=Ceratopteris richardii TaxID=49495 RepID=A0A8T2RIT4_CERRI|nr:hypothetical protein KP509_27G068900 [Ceratopteris richardii]KAH7295861.1 hypothetical protein KP509_27G068900 [Ceratopteris richardii]
MDVFNHPATKLGNLLSKGPNYVPLQWADASDQEFFRSEFQREAQKQVESPRPQQKPPLISLSPPPPSVPIQQPQQQQQERCLNISAANSASSPTPTLPTSTPPRKASTMQGAGTRQEASNIVMARSQSGGARDPPSEGWGQSQSSGLRERPVELHGAQPPSAPASVQTMVEGAVRLVTMLNFMKVELGDRKTLRSKEQWRAACAEFIGTMLFVYLGCGSVVATGMLSLGMSASRLIAIALAHGLAIAFLAGATGAISGGHLNPAVTLGFVVAGKETLLRAGLYIAAQLLGGVIGAALLKDATPKFWEGALGSHNISHGVYPSQALLMEIMLTFTLIFVIFGVAVDRRGPGVIAPIPIGFAVLVDHLVGVPYTGASMNPARSFGPAFVSGAWSNNFWIYWFGPCIGATLASALYRYVFLEPVTVLPTLAPMSSSTNNKQPNAVGK